MEQEFAEIVVCDRKLRGLLSSHLERKKSDEEAMRLTRATTARIVLLVLSAYFLVATSEDEPSVFSNQVEETLDITIGSPAQIQFDHTASGTELQPTVTIDFNVPGAQLGDVIVETLGELPENVFIRENSVTCTGCGDTISIKFSLAPDADIGFGTVFVSAQSAIYAEEWSEIEDAVLELKTVAIEQANDVIVLAQSTVQDGQSAWELTATPTVELETQAGVALDVFGAIETPLLLGPLERLRFHQCKGCPENPLYVWAKRQGSEWRLVTTDPDDTATVRALPVLSVEATNVRRDLGLGEDETIRFTVTVSIDGKQALPDSPKPIANLRAFTSTEQNKPRPRIFQSVLDPVPGDDQNFPSMRPTPTGWEVQWILRYETWDIDIDNFTAKFETTIRWIEELAPLDPESVRISVE